jgi:hypothetical protein
MKVTLKNIFLVALMAFYVIIILSNFSSFEGFVASDSTILDRTVTSESSTVSPSSTKPARAVGA